MNYLLAHRIMNSPRVDQYWSETFGVSPDELLRAGMCVVPHSRKLSGRNASWVFVHGDACVVSVPPQLIDDVREKAAIIPIEKIMSADSIRALFGDSVHHTIGPAYQGYAEAEDFHPIPSPHVRKLSTSDRPLLQVLVDGCDPKEWRDSGINVNDENLFGYFLSGSIVAVAGIIPWASYAANPSVVTHPDYRKKGYGKAVVSAAMQHILDQGSVVLYQTLLANVPAVRIAESLGCKPYAKSMYVAFKEEMG